MDNIKNDQNVETLKAKKWPWWKKTLVSAGSTIGGIVVIFLVVILILNMGKFGYYNTYYSIREVVCTNHGLNDNYVSQGIAVTNDGKYVFTSGYMSDKTHSRVYVIDTETDTAKYVRFTVNGKLSKGHYGGMAVSEKYNSLYIASDDKLYMVDLDKVMSANNGEIIDITSHLDVNNQASFVFTDDNYLYVGEFHDGGTYVTDNEYTYNGVTHYAIIGVYNIETLELTKVYSIIDKVQGFAIAPSGGLLFSTSFGLNDSHFYYYKESTVLNTNDTYDRVPLYFLPEADLVIKAPAMAEDLDYCNGKFYTNFESSCNKYFFGKFFIQSNWIVTVDIESLIPLN